MTYLVLGLILWIVAHLFKRVAPELRARMGDKAKGPVALVSLGAIVLMVIGYRGAEIIPLYTPVPGMGHFNNLVMVLAIYLSGVSMTNSLLISKLRHPLLVSAILWGIAHLLVNGDFASLILFGGMTLWALVEIILINRSEGPWQRPDPGTMQGEIKIVFGTILLVAVITYAHIWLSHNPFLGTYG